MAGGSTAQGALGPCQPTCQETRRPHRAWTPLLEDPTRSHGVLEYIGRQVGVAKPPDTPRSLLVLERDPRTGRAMTLTRTRFSCSSASQRTEGSAVCEVFSPSLQRHL